MNLRAAVAGKPQTRVQEKSHSVKQCPDNTEYHLYSHFQYREENLLIFMNFIFILNELLDRLLIA